MPDAEGDALAQAPFRSALFYSPFLPLSMSTITLGVPYKDAYSVNNAKIVFNAVRQRFPISADQCEPYVNVLTLRAWNQRGYRVKKGEKAIRVMTMIPVMKKDEKTGEKIPVGTRLATAYVFALPQVDYKGVFTDTTTHFAQRGAASDAASTRSEGATLLRSSEACMSAISGTTSASSMP